MKRNVLIFSLIISILSLIFLCVSYFGILRYGQLYLHSTEYYTNKYVSLPKADKNRVVVAFTASDKELANLKPFLNSILDQSVRVDDIALTIPYSRMKNVDSKLKKVLSVYGFSKDYGNASNLICTVLREPDANTKIIIVDPNVIYGKDFVESLVIKSNENPTKIVFSKDKNEKAGFLVKSAFFDEKIANYEKGFDCNSWLKKCCDNKDCSIGYSENLPTLPKK